MDEVRLLEPEFIRDKFITGVGKVELLGRNVRISLYVDQEGARVLVDSLVIEIDNIPACIAAVMKATWHQLTHVSILEVSMADRIGRH